MPGIGMSGALTDLGFGGGDLSLQVQNETEEQRKKRLLQQQQQQRLSPAASALGLGPNMGIGQM